MYPVTYEHAFAYTPTSLEESFPLLQFRISTIRNPDLALDIDAYLDSGAKRSLFDGRIATAIGIDLFSGPELPYVSTMGTEITGRLHRIRLLHNTLGNFELEMGFSTAPISRNLLGRDFFNLVQLGFRERLLTFYISTTP